MLETIIILAAGSLLRKAFKSDEESSTEDTSTDVSSQCDGFYSEPHNTSTNDRQTSLSEYDSDR